MIRRWRTTNCWVGRPFGPPIAFVLHTQAGGESGTVAQFLSSSAQFSAHYAVDLEGTIECFVDPEVYYATLAHECTHWTRHPTRLDRDFDRKRWTRMD